MSDLQRENEQLKGEIETLQQQVRHQLLDNQNHQSYVQSANDREEVNVESVVGGTGSSGSEQDCLVVSPEQQIKDLKERL